MKPRFIPKALAPWRGFAHIQQRIGRNLHRSENNASPPHLPQATTKSGEINMPSLNPPAHSTLKGGFPITCRSTWAVSDNPAWDQDTSTSIESGDSISKES